MVRTYDGLALVTSTVFTSLRHTPTRSLLWRVVTETHIYYDPLYICKLVSTMFFTFQRRRLDQRDADRGWARRKMEDSEIYMYRFKYLKFTSSKILYTDDETSVIPCRYFRLYTDLFRNKLDQKS